MSLTKQEISLLKGNALAIDKFAESLRSLLCKVNYVYITDDEYDEGIDKIYDESTILQWSDKHNMPLELVVMEIKEGGILVCNGLYDNYGENIGMEIPVGQVTYDALTTLAQLLPETL